MNRFTRAASSLLAPFRRREARSSFGGAGAYAPGLATLAGVAVTPQTALTFTAAFAAINVLSTDLASLPRGVYRRLGDGTEVPAFDAPQHRLVSVSPNEEQNSFRFRQHLNGHVHGWGNGYAEIVRDGRGEPVGLHPLHPATTRPKRTDAGRLYYEIDDNRKAPLLPENVLHLAGLGFDGLQGYCPVTLAREAIGLGKGAEEFGAALFGNGAVAGGILETPKRLTDNAARNLRESFERVHQGAQNAHRIAVLEEGTTWKSTQIPPEAAQFLATRQFQILEIARMWRLPPHKLGDYSQSHLANLEESNLDYLQWTLLGWVEMEEAELNLKLFSEADRAEGLFVKHDLASLMRGNTAARTTFYQGMRNMGAITTNEIRTREGMNPISPADGGNMVIVQGQYIPLSQVGKAPDPPAPGPPPDAKGLRYNHFHGKDGKFASGSHVGSHGGTIVPKGGKTVKVEGSGVAARVEALAEARRDPTSHTDHEVGHVGEIKTDLIKFDPERFQYKLGGQGDHGVTDALHGVKHFDPNLGGILQVWKDKADGEAYVVNGHHRLDLAKKLGAEKVAVRFIGAKDAAEARGIGALTNIAEGRGTSVDAAHFFRDTGHTRMMLEAKGIPMKERVATEGLALANLHKPIFDRVVSGEMSSARGAIIGNGLNHAQQQSVVKTLDKFGKSKAPSDATLRQTVLHAQHAPVAKVKTHDLFGENEDDVSLAFHRGETSAHVMERLSREKRVFGTVAKDRNAADLHRGGNVINTAESGKISKEAARNLDTFNLLQHRSGPVSKLLNEAAERIHKGEKKKAVHDDVYSRLPQAVQEALDGG